MSSKEDLCLWCGRFTEGPGSLLSCLIAKGWALELSAGGSDDSSSFSRFEVSIDLSDAGLRARDDVLALVFSYLGMLDAHGPQRWVWDEDAAAIAAAVDQQSSATREIARNVEQTAVGTEEVSTNIAGVRQAANDTGSAANQVLASARDLAQHGIQRVHAPDLRYLYTGAGPPRLQGY